MVQKSEGEARDNHATRFVKDLVGGEEEDTFSFHKVPIRYVKSKLM
jgi:hypothetical protein